MRKFLLIILLLVGILSFGQTPLNLLIAKKVTAASGPTFISYTETGWGVATTPQTTASISVNNGDRLIAFGVIEGQASSTSDLVSVAGGSLTWATQQEVRVASTAYVGCFTTTATSTTSFTVTFTHGGSAPNTSLWWGGAVFVFRNSSGGFGNSAKTNTTGAPSLSLTTAANNSAILSFNGDFAAVDGTSRTWRTINSITPSAGNGLEKAYFRNASHYALYGGYWNDAGTAGSQTVGLSAPTGQTYSIVAIEVKP